MVKVETIEIQEVNHWLVLAVAELKIEATLQIAKYEPQTVSVTLVPPAGTEIRMAYPMYAGAGEQPENTLSLIHLTDLVANTRDALVEGLRRKQDEW